MVHIFRWFNTKYKAAVEKYYFLQTGTDRISAVDDRVAVDAILLRQALSWKDADVGSEEPHNQEWNQECDARF